jgi:hypothetical protein
MILTSSRNRQKVKKQTKVKDLLKLYNFMKPLAFPYYALRRYLELIG